MQGAKLVQILFLSLFISPVTALPVMEGSVGMALHELHIDEESSIKSAGQYLNLSFGQRFKHSLSGAVSLRAWGAKDYGEEDDDEYELKSHVFGVSLGVEGQVFMPTFNHGPYAKFGRHCWGVSLINALDIWDGSGCSNIIGAGILLMPEVGDKDGSGTFYEVVLTRFKQLHSWMFVVGRRF